MVSVLGIERYLANGDNPKFANLDSNTKNCLEDLDGPSGFDRCCSAVIYLDSIISKDNQNRNFSEHVLFSLCVVF